MSDRFLNSKTLSPEVTLFGSFSLRPTHGPGLSRPAKEAIAYLAVNGETPRQVLAKVLWPGAEPVQARFYLRRTLTGIRQALGPHADALVTTGAGSVSLLADFDLVRFRAALEKGDFGDADKIYRSGFMSEFNSPWIELVRRGLADKYAGALQAEARALAAGGKVRECETLWRRLLALDPTSERAWHGLLTLFADAGHEQKADVTFVACKAAFREHSGSEPPRVLREIVRRRRRLIHTSREGFCGRDAELAAVLDLLAQFKLVTVTGVGGVGKSTLAREVCRIAADRFRDGLVVVDLFGVESGAVVSRVCEALGFGPEPRLSSMDALRKAMGSRELVLFLDNAERCLTAVATLVKELRQISQSSAIVITSRCPLSLSDEHRFRLAPMTIEVTESLFNDLALRANPLFRPSPHTRRLAELLDGIPLAIELAAAHLASFPLSELDESLVKHLVLDSVGHGRAPGTETARSVLAASYQNLDRAEQARFFRLGVFSGGFSLAAAQQVGGLSLAELSGLVERSLVEFDGLRYRLLEPVRQIAEEELRERGMWASAIREHANFYSDLASNLYDGPFLYDRDPPRFRAAQEVMRREESNLCVALRTLEATEGDWSDPALAIRISRFWLQIDLDYPEQVANWSDAVTRGYVPDTERAAVWLFTVGTAVGWCDDTPEARRLLDIAIERAGRHGLLGLKGMAHFHRGVFCFPGSDHYLDRIELFRVAQSVFASGGLHSDVLLATIYEAHVYREMGLEEDASRLAGQVLAAAERQGDMRGEILGLRLEASLRQNSSWERAMPRLEKAARLQRASGHWAEPHVLQEMARVAAQSGRYEEARRVFQQCVERCRELGYGSQEADLHTRIAIFEANLGEFGRAWEASKEALRVMLTLGRPRYLHLGFMNAAEVLTRTGRKAEACRIIAFLDRQGMVHDEVTSDQLRVMRRAWPDAVELEEWLPCPWGVPEAMEFVEQLELA